MAEQRLRTWRWVVSVVLVFAAGMAAGERVQVIKLDAEWAYNATGKAPGKGWTELGFDDSAWPKGLGVSTYVLVRKDTETKPDEEKRKPPPTLSFDLKPKEPGPTTYFFRRKFDLQDVSKLTAMTLELCHSSGFAVFINGREVLRHNLAKNAAVGDYALPPNHPKHIVVVKGGVGQETFTGLPTDCLKTGQNAIAVEMHRAKEDMKKVLFGLRLTTSTGFNMLKGPCVQRVKPDSATIFWETDIPSTSELVCGDRRVSDPKPKTVHVLDVTGLKPDTACPYEVRSTQTRYSGQAAVSERGSFQTAPAGPKPFRWVAYGDSRTGVEPHTKVAANILKDNAAFVVNTGDVAAHGADYELWGPQFFGPLADLSRRIPVYIAAGNHERNHLHLATFFATHRERLWHSFDYGNAHFLLIDTNVDLGAGSAQQKFIDEDLGASKALWKFAFFHHPPRSVNPKRAKAAPSKIELGLCPLLEKHKVDIVFNGHDHHYARWKTINGVLYVTTGGGGASLYDCQPADLCEVQAKVYHHCTIDVNGRNLSVRVTDVDGKEIDRFDLAKREP